MAQNGAICCTGDEVIDETGAEALLLAVAGQAGKDLRRRRTPAIYKRTALEFLYHIGLSDSQIEELLAMAQDKVTDSSQAEDRLLRDFQELNERADRLLQATQPDAPRRQKTPPAQEAEYQVTEDDLVQLGLDPRRHKTSEAQRARQERTQRLQETAQAIGLTPTRYTVDELERMFGGDING